MRLNAIDAGPRATARAPVVLIHGLFGQARNLGRIQRDLAGERRVVAFDLRNHGSSPHGAMQLRLMAGDIADSMDANGLGSAVLVGHSLGGKTAMATALLYPRLVRRLLVADIAPVAYRHANIDYARAMKALPLAPRMTRNAAHAALAPAIPDRGVRDLLLQNLMLGEAPGWQIGLDEIIASIGDAEGWPDFPPETTYDGRTLFLRAEHSSYVLPEHEGAIRRFFPRANIATLREAGHWLHADRPDDFARIVGDFVRGADDP
jgi:esterase